MVKPEPQNLPTYLAPVSKLDDNVNDFNVKTEMHENNNQFGGGMQGVHGGHNGGYGHAHDDDNERPINIKDDG